MNFFYEFVVIQLVNNFLFLLLELNEIHQLLICVDDYSEN
jgi:hypothetical protein